MFQPILESLIQSLHAGSMTITDATTTALRLLREKMEEEQWERIFDRCLKGCEAGSDRKNQVQTPISLQKQARLAAASGTSSKCCHPFSEDKPNGCYSAPGLSDDSSTPLTAEEIAKNIQNLKSRGKGRGKAGKPNGSPSPARKAPSSASKLMRKWGDSAVSEGDMAALDYSSPTPDEASTPVDVESLISTKALGKRSANGAYEIADWDYKGNDLPTEEEILAKRVQSVKVDDKAEVESSSASRWTSMFSRLTGQKTLTKEDLRPVLLEMEKHLMAKNVAKDISEKLCESIGNALAGKKLGGLTSEFRQWSIGSLCSLC